MEYALQTKSNYLILMNLVLKSVSGIPSGPLSNACSTAPGELAQVQHALDHIRQRWTRPIP
jgi:hypothetical protein